MESLVLRKWILTIEDMESIFKHSNFLKNNKMYSMYMFMYTYNERYKFGR